MSGPVLHVVLHQPDIPQNTGNIGRTCVAIGAKLWLVRPLGFQLDERHVRRAGLDYWEHLDWQVVDHWAELTAELKLEPNDERVWLVESPARRTIWEADLRPGSVLVFGSESRGLPPSLMTQWAARTVQLPMRPEVRSLNLASTVNTVVYEAVRQWGGRLPNGG
jgi:tRNA (cytidine/uridine-2'-O-)-methyltransferase